MVSFGFKRSCPLVGITQRPLPRRPFRSKWGGVTNLVGHRFEKGGAPLRPKADQCPTSRRNRAPLPSKCRPTSRRNQCPTSPGIRTVTFTLWRSCLDGSAETAIADDVVPRAFAVTPNQIYYLRRDARGFATLRSLTLATGKNAEIATITKTLHQGLSVSPDGKYALYAQIE